ncbi:MAG: hypothetical protein P4L31_05225, partial [Candidatus Babeliales bacterium]|nr:hypothetical protein [Candidatus Babeliales bacterium]
KKKPTVKKATVAKKKPQIYLDNSSSDSSSGSDSEDEVSKKGRKITKKKPVPRKPLPKPKPVAKVKKVAKKMTSRSKRSSRYSDTDDDSYSSSSDYSDSSSSDYSDSDYSDSGSEDDEHDEDYQGRGFHLPKKPAIFCLIGTQKSGKSHMTKYIIYSYCNLGYFTGGGLVFSPTKFNGDYNFMPDKAVIDHYDENILQRHIGNLRRLTAEGKKIHGEKWKLKPNFVILDDCQDLLRQSAFFNNWISTYRHTSTSVFIISQMLASRATISTLLRNSTTFAMMWPSISKNNIDAMYAAYGGVYDSLEEFKKALLKCKKRKYSCLLYKALQKKKNTYTAIIAEEVPPFKMTFGAGAAPNQQQQQQQQESPIGLQNIQTLPPPQQQQMQQQLQPQQQQQQWTPNFYQQPQMQQQQMSQQQPQFNLYQLQQQQYNPLYRFP